MQHRGEKLLKGEHPSHQAFEREGCDNLLLMQDMQTALFGIQVQDHMLTDQASRHIVAFEVNADPAMPIHFALQMQPIERGEPALGVHHGREGG